MILVVARAGGNPDDGGAPDDVGEGPGGGGNPDGGGSPEGVTDILQNGTGGLCQTMMLIAVRLYRE